MTSPGPVSLPIDPACIFAHCSSTHLHTLPVPPLARSIHPQISQWRFKGNAFQSSLIPTICLYPLFTLVQRHQNIAATEIVESKDVAADLRRCLWSDSATQYSEGVRYCYCSLAFDSTLCPFRNLVFLLCFCTRPCQDYRLSTYRSGSARTATS